MSSSSDSSSEQSDVPENDLPFPIVVRRHLFSYFSPQQLCSTLSPVCKGCHELSREAQFWRSLSLMHPSSSLIEKLFRDSRAPLGQLRTLNIQGWSEHGDMLVEHLTEHCPRLQRLTLIGSPEVTFRIPALNNLASRCPELTTLSLSARNVLTEFPCFPKLSDLSISYIRLNSAKDVTIFDNCIRLVSLRVKFLPPHSEHFEQFLKNHMHRMVGLGLYDANDPVSEYCYTKIARCENLSELVLTGGRELEGATLNSLLSGLKQLKKLGIEFAPRITGPQLLGALCLPARLNNLEALSLVDMAAVNDWTVVRITKRFSTKLKMLSLTGCDGVSDTGLHNILKCTKLRTLHVADLTRLTGRSLLQIPTALPQLTCLDIRGCNVALDVINTLLDAMRNPALHVCP